MKLGLGPGAGEIHDLVAQAGDAVLDVVKAVQQRFHEWPAGPTQDDVKQLEHAADAVVSRLIVATNEVFVAPYDREDIIELAFKVDNVADSAENASELLGLYNVESPTRQSLELCSLLLRAAEELATVLREMRNLHGDAPHVVRIKELEDEADDIARAARASLFRDDRIDPVVVIRWKDIYEALEEAIDACDTAASRVGNILVKNA